MARSKNHVVTQGLSGMIGNMLVFRQRANKTIVSDKPKPKVRGGPQCSDFISQRKAGSLMWVLWMDGRTPG